MKTFKILGLLLTYPEGSLYAASEEIVALLRDEALLPGKAIKRIERFLADQTREDILKVQEKYVETFDRGRALPAPFEHVHENRDRGQAMVDLSDTYASKGMCIDNNELPDYLPLFMEYLSRCSFAEAEPVGRGDRRDRHDRAKLKKRKSPYAAVFDAMEALSGLNPIGEDPDSRPRQKTPKPWRNWTRNGRRRKRLAAIRLRIAIHAAFFPIPRNTWPKWLRRLK